MPASPKPQPDSTEQLLRELLDKCPGGAWGGPDAELCDRLRDLTAALAVFLAEARTVNEMVAALELSTAVTRFAAVMAQEASR